MWSCYFEKFFSRFFFQSELPEWAIIFSITGIIYISTGIVFVVFGSVKLQSWNEKKETAPAESTS